ncbi:MAG: HAD-IA family hydrolase [Verrucomicrobiae bacterium]|nr:HAD-IA family hydrolase [Verrucomicrobiae bacterium]
MKQENSLRGVIFDMDGVLCDSEPFIAEAACRMFDELYQVKAFPSDFKPFIGTGEDRFIGGVAEKYGVRIDLVAAKARVYALYLEIIRGQLQPLAGAGEFMVACRKRGLKMAVATSADQIKLEGNLAQIRIPPSSFDVIVTGDAIKRKKPDPEVFLVAAAKLGLPAESCLVVEDAENGIMAGRAAGARCLGITTTYEEERLKACGAEWTAPDLAHVPSHIPGVTSDA